MHKSRSCPNERALSRRSRRLLDLRLRSTADQQRAVSAFAAEFDPQPFHLDEEARRTQFSRGWRQAVGIRRLSPCGSWSRASSSPRAVSLAPGSTIPSGPAMSQPQQIDEARTPTDALRLPQSEHRPMSKRASDSALSLSTYQNGMKA